MLLKRLEVVAALVAELCVSGVGIHEDRVSLSRGPVDRVGSAGGDPEGRRRLLIRLGQDFDLVEIVVVAVPGDSLLAPGLDHNLDRLAEARVGLLELDAEGAELGAIETASGTPVDASA